MNPETAAQKLAFGATPHPKNWTEVQNSESRIPAKTAEQKFVRDIVFSHVPIPFQKIRTYLWLAVLTRELGAADFGAWSLFIVTLSTAMTFSTMNCGSAMMRFLNGERTREEVDSAFSTVLALVALASGIFLIVAILFERWLAKVLFGSREALWLVLAAGAALLCDSLFEEIKNLLRARRQNQSWAGLCLARLLPEAFVVIFAGCLFHSTVIAAWAYVIVAAASVFCGAVYLSHRHDIRFCRPRACIAAKYLSYGLPLLPGVVASTVSLGADRFVVGGFLGMKEVGIYSACFTISALAFFLTGPIHDVLFPELSSLFDAGESFHFHERMRVIQKFVFGFASGAATLMAIFPAEILQLVSSREFASGALALAVLGIQGVFMAFVLLYVLILNVRRRVWSSSAFWIFIGAAILLLDIALLPQMGIAGAAISQLAVTGAGAAVLIVWHWSLFRETFEVKWIWQIALACLAVLAVSRVWPPASGNWQSILRIGFGALAFIGVLVVERYVQPANLRFVKQAVL